MTDEVFIKMILQKGKEAKDKVSLEFFNISPAQLNWKPSPQSWSIGQCLEHLILSHSIYFSDLKKFTEGSYKMSFWERYNPFSALCGRILKKQLQETPERKLKAPKIIQPSSSEMGIEVIDRYHQTLDLFLAYISNCRSVDIDKTIITSPTIRTVTYSLRDAFQFLIQHEHRHINQAIHVKMTIGFN